MRSDEVKKGVERAPHRSLLRATGVVGEGDWEKPFVAVVNSYVDVVPGHVHLREVGALVKEALRAAGAVPFEFNTIGVDDGIAMGHGGMRLSLPSRELIADWHDRLAAIGTWNAAARLRMVARQDRADDDPATGSGYDPAETAGFTVLDLFAGVQFSDRVGAQVGIDNVFDRDYAEHVPFRTTDDTNLGFVNAPGRFAWLRVVVNF